LNTRLTVSLGALGLALIVGAAIYYTGDQGSSVAVSGTFTIDTRDLDSVARPHTLRIAQSGQFIIDTRDDDTVARPSVYLLGLSGLFTIDTRDDDEVARPSLTQYELSGLFTIDTTADGSTYVTSGAFTIDTRDSDSLTRQFTLLTATSGLFIIDTTDPIPLDTDSDGLSNAWELEYFGDIHAAIWNEDTDGDGLSNRLEFLYGLNPLVPDNFGILEIDSHALGNGFFVIGVRLNPEALGGFNIIPQYSKGLEVWKQGLFYIEPYGIPTQNPDGTEIHYFKAKGPKPKQGFIRIVITDEN
jgi:hypothetical protein